MPYAVTHILFPIILLALFRDYYIKKRDRKNFPLHYVLLAGIGGALPDIDIPISFALNIFGVESWQIHKTFTHSLLFPGIFVLGFVLLNRASPSARICNITRHKLKLSLISLMLGIGALTHILLDSLFSELAYFYYPFSNKAFGTNLLAFLQPELQDGALKLLDGILLLAWIVYLELKHRISDFI